MMLNPKSRASSYGSLLVIIGGPQNIGITVEFQRVMDCLRMQVDPSLPLRQWHRKIGSCHHPRNSRKNRHT